MLFPKSWTMGIVLAITMLCIAIMLFVYLQGGVPHAVHQ
jgi:hypothetical protein